MPELLCLHERSMGPAIRNCSQSDLLIMDCSQSPYNHSELDSHCRSEQALSLKHSHAHVHPNKSCPALCSSRAIIVCLVQLHLKWQRPSALGRIKDCVQSNTPCTSCQRGCTAFPFSPAPPHFLLILCSYVRHKNILSFLLSYIKARSDSSSPLHPCSRWCCPPVLISGSFFLSLSKIFLFFCPATRGQSWSSLVRWRLKAKACALLPLLFSSAKDGEWYLYRPAVSVPSSPNAYLPRQKKHIRVPVCVLQALSVCRLN